MSFHHLSEDTPTSLGNWALLLANTLEAYGKDSHAVFKEAGVDLTHIKKKAMRFPTFFMDKLWPVAVQHTQDPYIALKVAQQFKTSTFSGLGLAMAASHHVYGALQRACRYASLISEDCTPHLLDDNEGVSFLLDSKLIGPPQIYGFSATFCCLYQILQEMAGGKLKVKAVHFSGELDSSQPFEAFFSCPVFYGATHNKMVFDKKHILTEQLYANANLASSLDEWIEQYQDENKFQLLSKKVENYLLNNLIHGELDQEKVASSLAMSPRLLQRKLKKEGVVYSQMFDECRKKIAIKLIHTNQHPMSEVAFMLGFSDQGNFSRAFKRWTGSSPYQYRC